MKRFSVLLICALALLANACEQHPASELEGGHSAESAHGAAHEPAKHEEKHAAEIPHAAAPHEAEKPATPTFFPEK